MPAPATVRVETWTCNAWSPTRNYITRMGASRVVIDPVGPLLFTRDAMRASSDQARLLFYGLQANTNTTNLLTTYAVERSVRGIEEYLVSGTLVLRNGARERPLRAHVDNRKNAQHRAGARAICLQYRARSRHRDAGVDRCSALSADRSWPFHLALRSGLRS